jgi:hypothetical protein
MRVVTRGVESRRKTPASIGVARRRRRRRARARGGETRLGSIGATRARPTERDRAPSAIERARPRADAPDDRVPEPGHDFFE